MLETPIISIGQKYGENGYETLSLSDGEKGTYEKLFIKDNHIDCYLAIAITDRLGLMYSYIKEGKYIGSIKDVLRINCVPISLMI